MSKDDVTQLVHRDSVAKGDGRRTDSIPPAWAVPAEAATGAASHRTDDGGNAVGVVVALVVVVVALGGLWYLNQANGGDEKETQKTAHGEAAVATASETPPTASEKTPQSGGLASPPPEADPKTPRAPNIAIGVKDEPALADLTEAALPDVATPPEPATDEPVGTEPTTEPGGEAAAKDAAAVDAAADQAKKARRYNRRAELAIKMAKYKTAEILLKKGIGLDPTYPALHRNLGVARARRKDIAGARAAYEEYIRLAPTAPDAPDVRRILGQ